MDSSVKGVFRMVEAFGEGSNKVVFFIVGFVYIFFSMLDFEGINAVIKLSLLVNFCTDFVFKNRFTV